MLQLELEICKFYKVLPTEKRFKDLTWIQKMMLWYGAQEDRKELHSLIKDVIEVLKPWLDKELWYNIAEQEKNTRTNINWGKSPEVLDEIKIIEG